MKLDAQQIELIGTAALEAELIRQGFEVARPNRDRGIDLIVYSDQKDKPFSAVPIQVKAATDRSFGIYKKYEKFTGLVLVFIWYATTKEPHYFLLTHQESLKFLKDPEGHSWQSNECYTWPKIPKWLEEGLNEYKDNWKLLHQKLAVPIGQQMFK